MKFTAVLTAMILFLPTSVHAQGTVTVNVDDPLYRDADRLIDHGLVTHAIVGQRPYSRRTLARIAREARINLDASSTSVGERRLLDRRAAQHLLVSLAVEVAQLDGVADGHAGIRASPLRELRIDGLVTDAPSRAVPPNGLGSVEADLNSLTDYRGGRRTLTGANLALESEHSVQFPAGISLQARPRAWWHDGRSSGLGGLSGELLSGNLRAVRANVAVTVGREYTEWAQAEDAGLFFSANAPALDMIRIASDAPFLLPSVLSRLGSVAATLQVADLGRSDSNSHSRLVSYKVSLRPTAALELGATFENHYGGAGARGASAFDRVIDLAPFLDIFRHHVDSTTVESDKLLGLDGRMRLESLGNISLFAELALEDFDVHRLRSIFTEDAAYTAGAIIPVLFSPALSARVGYHTVGIRFYEHHLVRNGIASRRLILGDNLGRDAHGFFGVLRGTRADGLSVTAEGAYDIRHNDTYLGTYTNADRTGLVFNTVATSPTERRTRGILGVRWFPSDARMMYELRGGAERTSNFGFVTSGASTHAVGSVTLALFP